MPKSKRSAKRRKKIAPPKNKERKDRGWDGKGGYEKSYNGWIGFYDKNHKLKHKEPWEDTSASII